ncbi:putative Ig domain-containing protein [Flavobacterium sp.]|uniref:putative Ig domain-containing protein n=1 Tax=Flavobacterium sp. TaxID=239 RepID=UPI002FDE094C
MKRSLKIVAFLCLILSFTVMACGELVDCIISAKPTLPPKTLRIGQVGVAYSETIQASVKNASNDDSYIYYLSIDNGLPPGIGYYQQGRKIIFTGTPTAAGTHTFKVHLTIDYPDTWEDDDDDPFSDSNNICLGNDTTSRNYTIVIE